MIRLLPLLLLAACLLAPPVAAQRPWTYRVWDNGDTPVPPPTVEVWGDAELREYQEAVPPTHGTVAFWVDGPCWRVSVGRWAWEDRSGCWNYHFPVVGAAGR